MKFRLDAGYSINPRFKGIKDREIIPVVEYRRLLHKKRNVYKE